MPSETYTASLTTDNLHKFTKGQPKVDMIARYQSSVTHARYREAQEHERLQQKLRSRHTKNFAIDATPLPFPFHNDAIFLPAGPRTASPCHSSTMSRDSTCSLSRSPSPLPVWWRSSFVPLESIKEPEEQTYSDDSSYSNMVIAPIHNSASRGIHPLNRYTVEGRVSSLPPPRRKHDSLAWLRRASSHFHF